MSHRLQKLLKRHVSTFLEIIYRTVVFLNVFVEEIFKTRQRATRFAPSVIGDVGAAFFQLRLSGGYLLSH